MTDKTAPEPKIELTDDAALKTPLTDDEADQILFWLEQCEIRAGVLRKVNTEINP
jgi:hypothetical protein